MFVFDGNGRHLQTVDALTGAVLYAFAYDAGGRLSSVTNVDGDVTQFNHDASGNLTAVVGPSGQQSTFTADANGYLARAADPAGQTTQFTYGSTGLLLTKLDARGNSSHYAYDTLGRLTSDQDATGASTTLARTDNSTGPQVVLTSAMGQQTTLSTTQLYPGAFTRTNAVLSGAVSTLVPGPTSTTVIELDAAQVIVTTPTPDSRPGFGMLSPTNAITSSLPSGLSSTRATTRAATYSSGNLSTFTDQVNLNGNTWTRLFNAATQTWTTTSPAGRQTTATVDATGRPTQISVPNVASAHAASRCSCARQCARHRPPRLSGGNGGPHRE